MGTILEHLLGGCILNLHPLQGMIIAKDSLSCIPVVQSPMGDGEGYLVAFNCFRHHFPGAD